MYDYSLENFVLPNCPYAKSLLSYQYYNRNSNPPSFNITNTEVNLINSLRMLWEQHDVWTRSTIMSIIFDLPDVDLVTKRLLRNPVDFGNALEPFYGKSISQKFSDLLKDHLVIAAELVKAAKAGNKKKADEAEKRWYDNADQIAIFLGTINPFWSQEEWRAMLHQHLALVKSEAVSILTKNYAAGIDVYDELERQSLGMADILAYGIIKQFPNKFVS